MPLFSRVPFSVSLVEGQGQIRLVLRGELDIATVQQLVRAVEQAEERRPELLVFDAEQLGFIDASGLKVMLRAARQARRDGRRVELRNPSDPLSRIARITAIDQTIDIVSDETAAPP